MSLALLVAAGVACSSSDSNTGTGGAAGTSATGGRGGAAGAAGAGGRGGAGGAVGGAGGSGGAGGGGGRGGSGGAGGGSGGAGGRGGTGGVAGGVGGAAGGTTSGLGGAAALTVTSPSFTDGQTIAMANTCAGANTSPALTWTAGPTGTMSYAVVLTDLSIASGAVIHWVIWDLPAATLTLPAALPNTATLTTPVMAKQAHHIPFFQNTDSGYRGPCPSGMLHMYQFEVVALDVATLPAVTTASTPPEVRLEINAHALAHGDLTGTSSASAP